MDAAEQAADVVAVGRRVALRRWRGNDAGAVFEACQDPEIQRWTTLPVPHTRQDAEWFAGELSDKEWAGGEGVLRALVTRDEGRLAGSTGLHWVRQGIGEVGYWTVPGMRRRGHTSEGLRLLAGWALRERSAARIPAQGRRPQHRLADGGGPVSPRRACCAAGRPSGASRSTPPCTRCCPVTSGRGHRLERPANHRGLGHRGRPGRRPRGLRTAARLLRRDGEPPPQPPRHPRGRSTRRWRRTPATTSYPRAPCSCWPGGVAGRSAASFCGWSPRRSPRGPPPVRAVGGTRTGWRPAAAQGGRARRPRAGCHHDALDTRHHLVEARNLYAGHGCTEVPASSGAPYAEHWFDERLGAAAPGG